MLFGGVAGRTELICSLDGKPPLPTDVQPTCPLPTQTSVPSRAVTLLAALGQREDTQSVRRQRSHRE